MHCTHARPRDTEQCAAQDPSRFVLIVVRRDIPRDRVARDSESPPLHTAVPDGVSAALWPAGREPGPRAVPRNPLPARPRFAPRPSRSHAHVGEQGPLLLFRETTRTAVSNTEPA